MILLSQNSGQLVLVFREMGGEGMDILFEMTEQTEYRSTYTGTLDGEVIGRAVIVKYQFDEALIALRFLYLEGKGKGLMSRREFTDLFVAHLKSLGYTGLYMETLDMEEGYELGFQVLERDNSGWYPKYLCHREF